jgi:hypothetical protein
MAFTSSWTEDTVTSAVSTGLAVTSGEATGAGVETVFLDALAGLGASTAATGAGTTGVATTGAAGAVFLETDFLGVAELIILVAVEVFMAGIRTLGDSSHSILGSSFNFFEVKKFFGYLVTV